MNCLDRKEFENWLKAHDPDLNAGWVMSAASCPIAKFVANEYQSWPDVNVSVNRHDTHVISPQIHDIIHHDYWAREFVQSVDKVGAIKQWVSFGEALAILENIDDA